MTAQAEERISTPSVRILQPLPLTYSPIKVLTPTKASFEPLHLSLWCNQTRPTKPPPTTPIRAHPRTSVNKTDSPCQPSSPECLHKSQPRTLIPSSFQWKAPSELSPSKSTLNPSASEFVPKTYKPKPIHNPLGGKLALVAAGFFERAYGLNGQSRVEHAKLKEEMMALTGCSERAVQAVLYGSSYSDLLDGLRAKVSGYTVQKDMAQDFTLLPFYGYNGNQNQAVPATPNTTNYGYIAVLALAAMIPFTFLC